MYTNRPIAVALVGLLMLSAASPAFVGTAAAHHESDENPLDEILAEAEDGETEEQSFVSKLKGFVPEYVLTRASAFDGQMSRFYDGALAKTPFGSDAPTNKEHARTFMTAVDVHEGTYTGFVSNATTPSKNYSVHKVTFAHEASDPYTVYVVGEIDAENDSVTNIETHTADEFDASERDVDVEWVVDGRAAGNLSDLTATLAERIEADKPIDRDKQSQLVGKYCDFTDAMQSDAPIESCDIRSSLWMDHDSLYEEVDDGS